MAVYKEGFYLADQIQKRSVRIYPDACDFGAPTSNGDETWKMAGQLVKWYGIKDTRDEAPYSTGVTINQQIRLIDESTGEEVILMLTFIKPNKSIKVNGSNYQGYFLIERIS